MHATKLSTWIVTTSGERPATEVAAALAAAGFAVDDVMDAIGVISGRCAAASVDRLRQLAGVADVSPSAGVEIGPPGSADTW